MYCLKLLTVGSGVEVTLAAPQKMKCIIRVDLRFLATQNIIQIKPTSLDTSFKRPLRPSGTARGVFPPPSSSEAEE